MGNPDIRWRGKSGRNYGYWIHPIDAGFRKIAGNCIFAKQNENGEWIPLYVGQTRNFDHGVADEVGVRCAREKGATHVHVHLSSPDESIRMKEANDIVAEWKPVCNEIAGE